MDDIDPWRQDEENEHQRHIWEEAYQEQIERRNVFLVEFAEWIVSLDDDDPNSPGRQARKTVTLTQIINRAREALDG